MGSASLIRIWVWGFQAANSSSFSSREEKGTEERWKNIWVAYLCWILQTWCWRSLFPLDFLCASAQKDYDLPLNITSLVNLFAKSINFYSSTVNWEFQKDGLILLVGIKKQELYITGIIFKSSKVSNTNHKINFSIRRRYTWLISSVRNNHSLPKKKKYSILAF